MMKCRISIFIQSEAFKWRNVTAMHYVTG